MMQSLLLNNAASTKNNELKTQDNSRSEDLQNSKVADQQKRFAKVMQDNIDKENARAESRNASRSQEANKDKHLASKDDRVRKEPIDEKNTDNISKDKKASNKSVEENKKITKSTNNDENKVESEADAKNNESSGSSNLELGAQIENNEGDELLQNNNGKIDQEEDNTAFTNLELDDNVELDKVDLADSEGILIDSSLSVEKLHSKELPVIEEIDATSMETEEGNNDDFDLSEKNALLLQIETAQQVDTKVKSKGEESPEISMLTLNGKSNSISTDDKKSQSLIGQLDVDPELEADSEIDISLAANEDTSNVDNELDLNSSFNALKPIEKADQFSTLLKNENAIANQSIVDVNGAKPNQTSQVQLDKLVAFNQQAPAANNLLQEPLDIQSKHAASMMGERVMMMMSQGKQEVQIRLDPAEMGSMLIKVQVQQDQVQLHIQTQAGLSKDIIEQNMPRLREQLAQQGIQLSEANVQQQSQQQNQQQNQQQHQINNGSGLQANSQEAINEPQNVFIPSKIPSLEQGIDYYA